MKAAVLQIAHRLGWKADAEVRVPCGRIADTLLERGGRRVAVEIQWSQQAPADYRTRSDDYREDGIEVVWVTSHSVEDDSPELPVMVQVVGDRSLGNLTPGVLVSAQRHLFTGTLREFIARVLAGETFPVVRRLISGERLRYWVEPSPDPTPEQATPRPAAAPDPAQPLRTANLTLYRHRCGMCGEPYSWWRELRQYRTTAAIGEAACQELGFPHPAHTSTWHLAPVGLCPHCGEPLRPLEQQRIETKLQEGQALTVEIFHPNGRPHPTQPATLTPAGIIGSGDIGLEQFPRRFKQTRVRQPQGPAGPAQ